MNLIIPDYQRPYKWTEVHVNQLVGDILHHMAIGKKRYRLGTIVLYQNIKNEDEIVDGQQRLLSLSMMCYYLGEEQLPELLNKEFSDISLENLKHNADHIKKRIDSLEKNEKGNLKKFFLEQCELVCVTLNDISEAFQFFDSQNSRGKGLETYDLLKAFHLREMQGVSEKEINECVENWENQAKDKPDNNMPNLKTIINDVLFPLRRWAKGDFAFEFTKEHINVFKGVNFHNHHYPHIAGLRAVEHTVISLDVNLVRLWGGQPIQGYPFQINQVIINGKRFFEYIQHHSKEYKNIFLSKNKIIDDCLDKYKYEDHGRSGDELNKKLFFISVFSYCDKFNNYKLSDIVDKCFRWSYFLRVCNPRISNESINNYVQNRSGDDYWHESLIKLINNAVHPTEIMNFYIIPPIESKQKGRDVKGISDIKDKDGSILTEGLITKLGWKK